MFDRYFTSDRGVGNTFTCIVFGRTRDRILLHTFSFTGALARACPKTTVTTQWNEAGRPTYGRVRCRYVPEIPPFRGGESAASYQAYPGLGNPCSTPPPRWRKGDTFTVLRGTIVNGTCGTHKNLPVYISYFYEQYLVLFTMVPGNSRLLVTTVVHQRDQIIEGRGLHVVRLGLGCVVIQPVGKR